MRPASKIKHRVFATAIAAGAIAVGCASAPLHTEGSTSGIRAAREVGASRVPRAALHLQLAREELGYARSLANDGEDERAASMLMRSEADAQLAVALSREASEQSEAREAVEQARELRRNNQSSLQGNSSNKGNRQ